MYLNGPLKDYLDDLAAKKPAPGGGSAAALTAAIGAGLMSMVANYTVNNPEYKNVAEKAAVILSRCEDARRELEALIDKDVNAYNDLSKTLKESGNDAVRMEAVYKDAVRVPFDVCMISAECLKLCNDLAECGNKRLITDTEIAALLLDAAFISAKFNVYINMKNMKDMDFIGEVHGKLAPLEEEMPKLKEEILEKCEDVIAK
jgi:formiminotetrahydrofolate cyclodeaminase